RADGLGERPADVLVGSRMLPSGVDEDALVLDALLVQEERHRRGVLAPADRGDHGAALQALAQARHHSLSPSRATARSLSTSAPPSGGAGEGSGSLVNRIQGAGGRRSSSTFFDGGKRRIALERWSWYEVGSSRPQPSPQPSPEPDPLPGPEPEP